MSRSQIITFAILGLIVVLQTVNLLSLRSLSNIPARNAYSIADAGRQYPVSNNPTPVPSSALQDEITQIHAELRSLNQVLGVSKSTPDLSNILTDPTPIPTPTVSQLTTSVTINVYQDPSFSSRPLDQKLNPGQNYPYTSSKDSWYLVSLPNGSSGWVNSPYIKLFSNGQP